MRRTAFRTIATTTATLTLAATAFTAHAASPTPDAEDLLPDADLSEKYPDELLQAMQDDLDVTEDRALERLDFQAEASVTLDELDDALGDDFAGLWLDAEDDVVYAAVTDATKSSTVRKAGAKAVTADYSLEDLEQWQSSLIAPLSDVDGVPGTYVDLEENSIVVQVHRGARGEARQAAKAAGVPQRAVSFEVTTEEPQTFQDIIGGNAYFTEGFRCSVGFAVTEGFVTAGHCGPTGATTTQPTGTFAGSVFPGSDMAWVRTASGNTPVGAVNDYSGGVVDVAGSTQAPVGSQVCRSGSTTGWHCGTIQAYNATVTYAEGSVNGLIRTTVCAEKGDSGGSLLAGDQAQGVTSGGSGNCSTGGTTYFQPVNPILNRYNLTLVTGGGGNGGGGQDPSCTGSFYSGDGSLSQGGQAVHPDGSYWYQSSSATIAGCVEGPSGGDFDVYLQRWTGSSWSTVAQGATTSNLDSLSYSASSGYYRLVVHAYSGSGAYTTGITVS